MSCENQPCSRKFSANVVVDTMLHTSNHELDTTYNIASLVPVSVHLRSAMPEPSARAHNTHIYVQLTNSILI